VPILSRMRPNRMGTSGLWALQFRRCQEVHADPARRITARRQVEREGLDSGGNSLCGALVEHLFPAEHALQLGLSTPRTQTFPCEGPEGQYKIRQHFVI
jgi:hypothetical protein